MCVTVPRRCWDGCSACQTARTAGWPSALHPGWSHTSARTPWWWKSSWGDTEQLDKTGKHQSLAMMSSQQLQQPTPPALSWVNDKLCARAFHRKICHLLDTRLWALADSAVLLGQPSFWVWKKPRFNWAWCAGRHLCQQKWELWTCNTAEEFLILFWRVYPAVLLLSPARAPLFIISLAASIHIKVHCYFHLYSSKSGKNWLL